MKIRDILNEGEVVPFGKANKKDDRKYGVGGYKEGSEILSFFKDMLAQKKADLKNVTVQNTKPQVKATKRPAEGFIRKIFQELPEEIQPSPYERGVASSFLTGGRFLNIGVRINQEMQKNLKKLDNQMAARVLDVWGQRMAERVSEALGYYLQDISYRIGKGSGRTPPGVTIRVDNVTDKYFEDAGIDLSKLLPTLGDKIKNIFDSHNIGGLGFVWVDRQRTGYRIKIEGAEAIDEKSLRRLAADLKTAFGDDFIKLKMDSRELAHIGGRPVGKGLTNYRLWLSHNIKGRYRLH